MRNALTPFISAGAFIVLVAIASFAPGKSLAHETGRYALVETEDGVLRLDREQGSITSCKNIDSKWVCKPVDEPDLSSLDTSDPGKVARLQRENKQLREQIKDLEAIQKYKPDGSLESEEKRKLKLPSDEEIDEALSYMERLIRKFGGTIKRLKEENKQEGEEL